MTDHKSAAHFALIDSSLSLFLFIPGVMHDGHYLLVRHAQVNDAATPRVRLGRQLSVITRLCQLYNILVTVHITTRCHSTSQPGQENNLVSHRK